MSLARSETELSIRSPVDLDNLVGDIVKQLEQREGIRTVERFESDDGYHIRAETEPSLASWGQEISIYIRDGTIHIESETPNQWVDWGTSKQNVKSLSELVQRSIESAEKRPA